MSLHKEDEVIFKNNFFYRLLNVLYVFLLILTCITALVIMISGALLMGFLFAAIVYVLINITKETLLYIFWGKTISFHWLLPFKKTTQIYEKQTSTQHTILLEPFTVAALIVKMLIEKQEPFINWKPNDISIPENLDSTAYCAVIGYSLYLYLLLIRMKFGKEVSLTVKNQLMVLLNKIKKIGEYLVEILTIIDGVAKDYNSDELTIIANDNLEQEVEIGAFFLINLSNNPYYIDPEERAHLDREAILEHCGRENLVIIAKCLFQVKESTLSILKPMVDRIVFKPESILGLNVSGEFAWSSEPGCFEKHLQRKFNNQIFSLEKREISQNEIDQARRKDKEETDILRADVADFFETMPKPGELSCIPDEMRILVEQLDNLTERALQLGGESLSILSGLYNMREKLISTWRIAISYSEAALVKFDEGENINSILTNKYHHPFIQQVMRNDSPIKDDIVESILSEDIETIKLAVDMLSEKKEIIKNEALTLVGVMLLRGENMPMLEEKLAILGVQL